MSVPRYLYILLSVLLALEIFERVIPENVTVALGMSVVTLLLCGYAGARGVMSGRGLLRSALWALPLPVLGVVAGLLTALLSSPAFDRAAYFGFFLASAVSCVLGLIVGLIGGLVGRVVERVKKVAD